MDFIAPPDLRFTLPQLRRFVTEGVKDFLLDGGSTGEAEQSRELMKAFLGYMESKIVKLGEQEKEKLTTIDTAPVPTSPSFGFGKVNLNRTSITQLRKNRIMPLHSQASTALSILNSPEASQFMKFYNEDLDTENKMVLQMDNFVQEYMEEEETMITSGLELISSLKMKGAILFKGE